MNFNLYALLKDEKVQGILKTAFVGAAVAGLLAWMMHVEKAERGDLS